MTQMSGAAFLAETMHGYGVTHFFFMPVIVDDAMPHMEKLGITSKNNEQQGFASILALTGRSAEQ